MKSETETKSEAEMTHTSTGQTLQEAIAERIAAEQAARAKAEDPLEQKRKWDEAHGKETARANAIIATIRAAMLAPSRNQWRKIMTLRSTEIQVKWLLITQVTFAPLGDAAQQVWNYCVENGLSVEIREEPTSKSSRNDPKVPEIVRKYLGSDQYSMHVCYPPVR